MWRILAILGGVSGAVALSQFPEFSQQYLQRLAGKVDVLTEVAARFDATAAAHGLTREAALVSMTGTPLLVDQQADQRMVFAQAAVLADNLAVLRAASPLVRLTMPQRFGDTETLAATYADFRPAIPATSDGAVTAGIGYVGGWAVIAVMWRVISFPFRSRRRRYV